MLLVLTLIVAISNFLLGFISFISNRKSATNRIFFVFSMILAVWSVSNYFSVQHLPLDTVFNWLKVVMISTAAMFPALFLLSKAFPHEKLGLSKWSLILILLFIFLIQLLVAFSFVFTGIKIENGIVKPIPGPALPVFGISLFLFLGLTIYTLIQKYRVFTDVPKLQLKYLILGITLTFGLATLTNFVFVNFFGITIFVPVGPLFTIILVAFVSYAIVKSELFSIKIVTAEILTGVMWLVIFSRIFIAPSLKESLVDVFTFVAVFIFGIQLIRSVYQEVEQRRKLELLTKKLKELDERKNEFINMAAHELRAPLTAVKGYISMVIEGDAGEISKEAKNYLEDANLSNERMIRLVNNLLNVSRIEENRIMYQIETFKLSELAQRTHTEFKVEAERKGLGFELEIPEGIVDTITADKDRLQEVIINFVSNALKYTENGKVVIKISNKMDQLAHKWVKLEVIDTGPGITEAEQKKLFHKFYRVKESTGKTIGTGLGLYISKLLITKFGGNIGVVSEQDSGSNFWFELPIDDKGATMNSNGL